MSTNAELITEKNQTQLLRPGKMAITIIQLVIFVALLIFIRWYQMSGLPNTYTSKTPIMQLIFFRSLVANPIVFFLGTILFVKGLQLLYKKKAGEIGLKKIRTVLFVVSVINIVVYAVCILYIVLSFNNKQLSTDFYWMYLTRIDEYVLQKSVIGFISDIHDILGFFTGIFFMAKSA